MILAGSKQSLETRFILERKHPGWFGMEECRRVSWSVSMAR